MTELERKLECVFVYLRGEGFVTVSVSDASVLCDGMEGASMSTNPRTVDEVFIDFKGRRSGMLKALTIGT